MADSVSSVGAAGSSGGSTAAATAAASEPSGGPTTATAAAATPASATTSTSSDNSTKDTNGSAKESNNGSKAEGTNTTQSTQDQTNLSVEARAATLIDALPQEQRAEAQTIFNALSPNQQIAAVNVAEKSGIPIYGPSGSGSPLGGGFPGGALAPKGGGTSVGDWENFYTQGVNGGAGLRAAYAQGWDKSMGAYHPARYSAAETKPGHYEKGVEEAGGGNKSNVAASAYLDKLKKLWLNAL